MCSILRVCFKKKNERVGMRQGRWDTWPQRTDEQVGAHAYLRTLRSCAHPMQNHPSWACTGALLLEGHPRGFASCPWYPSGSCQASPCGTREASGRGRTGVREGGWLRGGLAIQQPVSNPTSILVRRV